MEVEEGDEEIGGRGGEVTVEVSRENTETGRSEDDADVEGVEGEEDGEENKNKKKRKKLHRHTTEQIRALEALFKESSHPNLKQRQQLSKQLDLDPRQIKFWFQNRRTQIKAMRERHENSLFKSEMEKIQEENRSLRATVKACCPNCGFATSGADARSTTEEQQLRIENERLKDELEKLHATAENSRTTTEEQQLRIENERLKDELEKLRATAENSRTTIEEQQLRIENARLKAELEKLRRTARNSRTTTEKQQLRIENARLEAELERLRATVGKYSSGAASPSFSCSTGNDQENGSSLDYYTRNFELEKLMQELSNPSYFGAKPKVFYQIAEQPLVLRQKSRILEIVNQAMEELTKMATAGDPLWIRSVENGREILNYDEYILEFSPENSGNGPVRLSIEASRETGVVSVDLPKLVQAFMDVNQWKEMFPCMISKAATIDVISSGEGANRNGAVQLMFAELQMLTPMVPTRQVHFIRYCKKQSPDRWAVVDVSIDKVEDNTGSSPVKCRKRASGCIIEDKSNGHCKVIWVEHLECQKSAVHTMYHSIVSNGLAFGATHWMETLQLQCERLVFFMATNVPTKDSSGVATLVGRKSTLQLAQRMTQIFCRAVGASSYNTWSKLSTKWGDDIRVSARKNLNDPGEPLGMILCAVSSVFLPVSPHTLFDFLRDEARRNEWDTMSTGGPVQSIANLAKGEDRGNAVTIHATKSKDSSKWVIQDSCTNAYESMLVYAPVDITSMQSVMTGCDSSNVAILTSGFSILPDGLETRPPLVITSRPKTMDGGSLLTIAFQILANISPTAKLTVESVENVNILVSHTLKNIKTSLECDEDGL